METTDLKKIENIIVQLSDSIEILSGIDEQDFSLREKQQLHESVISAVQDAISVLKALEPRVMSWDEVKAWHKTELSEREPIFVEYRPEASFGPSRWWLENFGIAAVDDGAMVCYNKYLRCWTSRPSDAQREATPWPDTAPDKP